MRTGYRRASHRPYPRLERAWHQIERVATVPVCSRCRHAVHAHAVDEQGRRHCTRGEGVRIACRECALIQASLTEPARGLAAFVEAFSLPPRASTWAPLLLGSTV